MHGENLNVAARVGAQTRSARIRAQLAHPVIDSDGHIIEFEAAVLDKLESIAGSDIRNRYKDACQTNTFGSFPRVFAGHSLSVEERLKWRYPRAAWWAFRTGTDVAVNDHAAVMLPGLLHERLDETGMDFSILYPTSGLVAPHLDNPEFRLAGCRAYNAYTSEAVAPYSDRLRAVAVIPMHTPQEAVAELEYAVKVQGFKCVLMPSYVVRPIPGVLAAHPEVAQYTSWYDNYCVDSLYDYDPVWAKCVELGVAPTFHTPGYGLPRASVTNWMMNHVGTFATGGEGICRALFMGGVPQRFPSLRFAFLEGGVGYGVSLYADLIGHWKKRNRAVLQDFDPRALDLGRLRQLMEKYGGPSLLKRTDKVGKSEVEFWNWDLGKNRDLREIDEFGPCGVERIEDFKRLFVDRFFFGCESDDPVNAWAFAAEVNPLGAKLKAILSSDIGHFDVVDIRDIVEEAYEAVEHGIITEEDFRAFAFSNPLDLWCAGNPNFFAGTVIERAAAEYLGGGPSVTQARA